MPPRLPGEGWADYAIRHGVQPTERNMRSFMQLELTGNIQRRDISASEFAQLVDQLQQLDTERIQAVTVQEFPTAVPPSMLSDFDTVYQEGLAKDPAPAKGAKHMTPERERELMKAVNKLEEKVGIDYSGVRSKAGRKELGYRELMRRHKIASMTLGEIVFSEVPLRLQDLDGQKFSEVARAADVNGISGDGRNTRMQFTCQGSCHMEIPSQYAYFCAGQLYCAICVPKFELCRLCNDLKTDCSQVTTYDERSIMACGNCVKRRSTCQQCGEPIARKYIEPRLCLRDINRVPDSFDTRHFSHSLKWIGKELGNVVKSPRMFSCEVEGFAPRNDWGPFLVKTLPKEMGIATDGSLQTNERGKYGFEVQTPKLAGKLGEELVTRMSAGLKELKVTVNETCGMHVHIDAKGVLNASRREYPVELLQMFKTYIVFEDVLLSFMPYSRRRNDYCRPLGDTFLLDEVETLQSVADVEKLWYKERTYHEIRGAKATHYHASRYFGTNLNSLLKDGHLEIRFHSGTTNARKILEWANLHALILDACAARVFNPSFLQEARGTSRLSEKTTMLFDAIGLASSSRQYFRARQKKFGDKGSDDEEIKREKPAKKNGLLFARPSLRMPPLRSIATPNFIGMDEAAGMSNGTWASSQPQQLNRRTIEELALRLRADENTPGNSNPLVDEIEATVNRIADEALTEEDNDDEF